MAISTEGVGKAPHLRIMEALEAIEGEEMVLPVQERSRNLLGAYIYLHLEGDKLSIFVGSSATDRIDFYMSRGESIHVLIFARELLDHLDERELAVKMTKQELIQIIARDYKEQLAYELDGGFEGIRELSRDLKLLSTDELIDRLSLIPSEMSYCETMLEPVIEELIDREGEEATFTNCQPVLSEVVNIDALRVERRQPLLFAQLLNQHCSLAHDYLASVLDRGAARYYGIREELLLPLLAEVGRLDALASTKRQLARVISKQRKGGEDLNYYHTLNKALVERAIKEGDCDEWTLAVLKGLLPARNASSRQKWLRALL